MKKILLLASLLLCCIISKAQSSDTINASIIQPATPVPTPAVTNNAPQNKRFGYLSYSEALKMLQEYATAQKSIVELKNTYDNEMNRSEAEFTRKFNEFLDGQKNFPENILLKRQKELQLLMEQSISFKDEAKKLLQKSENELMAPIHQRLKDILSKIGQERGFEYILNTDNNSYPFINTNNGEDITELVRQKAK